MLLLLLTALTSLPALAGEAQEPTELSWDLTLNGKKVGERTLTVRTESLGDVELRTLQSQTRVDASILGMSLDYRQKLTANADIGPASFISVVDEDGAVREVQGRRAHVGWMLTVTENGRSSTQDLPLTAVDLSSADLLDPDSRVPLSRFTEARILFAETGDVQPGTVEPLGPSEVVIDGQAVPVEGYTWRTSPPADARFSYTAYYTAEGWLVRFESKVMGQEIAGTLVEPPPKGPDSEPVDVFGPGLETVEL